VHVAGAAVAEELVAEFGRLTWHWPQLAWQAVQWFLRPGSTTVSQFVASSPARARNTFVKTESVACREVEPLLTCSSWHSAQTCWPPLPNGGTSVGSLTTPWCASERAAAAGLPPWHCSQVFSAWSVLKNSWETSTLSCSANGATDPPQPLPACIADAAGVGMVAASALSFSTSVWQATHEDDGFAAASSAAPALPAEASNAGASAAASSRRKR
jgi:hypothetical protein